MLATTAASSSLSLSFRAPCIFGLHGALYIKNFVTPCGKLSLVELALDPVS